MIEAIRTETLEGLRRDCLSAALEELIARLHEQEASPFQTKDLLDVLHKVGKLDSTAAPRRNPGRGIACEIEDEHLPLPRMSAETRKRIYEILLANGINHPNDLGHEFFAECLMRLVRPSR